MEEERCLKLNLEYYPKSLSFTIILFASLSFLISLIVASLVAPDIIDSSSLTFPKCPSTDFSDCISKNETNPIFTIEISLKPHNQMLYLECDFKSSEDIHLEIPYKLTLYYKKSNEKKLETMKNKTMEINCESSSCTSQLIFYIPYIKYDDYIAKVTFYNQLPVDSLKFSIKFITKDFTNFFLATKYFFLSLSILALGYFCYSLFRVRLRHWPRQSKIIGLMLVSLVLFNEPLLALSLQRLTTGWSGVSVFCNSQFAAFLLMFWFLILHDDFSWKKWLFSVIFEGTFVFIFFILTCFTYMFTTVELKFDPTFSWNDQFPDWIKRVFIAALVILVILAIWMVVLVVYSILKFRARLLRDKVLSCTVYGMIIASFLLIGLGAFQPLPRSGAVLLVSLSLFNLYFITLAWMFSPNRMDYLSFELDIIASPHGEAKEDQNRTILAIPVNLQGDNKV